MKKLNIVLITFISVFIFSCNSEPEVIKSFSCGAEAVSGDKSFFLCEEDSSATFRNPGKNSQDKTVSLTGEASLKLEGKKMYGFAYELKKCLPGQVYRVSCWKKGDAKKTFLVVDSKKGKKKLIYHKVKKVVSKKEGWEKIEKSFQIPKDITESDIVKVYVWNPGKKKVYIDDLKIEQLTKMPGK